MKCWTICVVVLGVLALGVLATPGIAADSGASAATTTPPADAVLGSERPQVQAHCDGTPVDVRFNGPWRAATGYEAINGVSQRLNITTTDRGALLKGILVRDWPTIIRLDGGTGQETREPR